MSQRTLTIFVATLLLLQGCASAPERDANVDPFEPFNREVYAFNRDFDKGVLKPVSGFYTRVTPLPVRRSVTNFFDNLGYLNVILNDFLQGKGVQGANDTLRFLVNTTIGVAGLFDPATGMGLERHDEDFGQTLGVWGMGQGPYLVLPLFGPSSVRDVTSIPVAIYTNPMYYLEDDEVTVSLTVLNIIDERARAERALRFLDQAALDPYIFMREAYLQKRRAEVYDGNPPPEEDEWLDPVEPTPPVDAPAEAASPAP